MNKIKVKNFITLTGLFISCLMYFSSHSSVSAASINVSGSCSYNNAISSANTNVAVSGCVSGDPGLDSIVLPSGVTTLSGNPVEYTESISFQGNADGTTELNAAHTASYAISNHTTALPNVDLTVDNITFSGFGLSDGSSKTVVVGHASTTGNVEASDLRFTDTWIYNGVDIPAYSYSSIIKTLTANNITISQIEITGTTMGKTEFIPLSASSTGASQITLHDFTFDGLVSDQSGPVGTNRSMYSVLLIATNIDLRDVTIININLQDTSVYAGLFGLYVIAQDNLHLERLRMNNNNLEESIGALGSGGFRGFGGFSIFSGNTFVTDIDISNNTVTSASTGEALEMMGVYAYLNDNNTSVINNYSFTNNTYTNISSSSTGPGLASAATFVTSNSESDSGTVTMRNSTISNNNGLGAIMVYPLGSNTSSSLISIENSTISDNQMYSPNLPADLSSIHVHAETATDYDQILNIQNTILSNNTRQSAAANCGAGSILTSLGSNLSNDSTCTSAFSQSSDIHNIDPLLEPLSTPSGSFGPMRLLTTSSPAIDKAATLVSITSDQRGTSRPQGAAYDIGAHEHASIIGDTPINQPRAPRTGGVNVMDNNSGIVAIASMSALFMIIKRFYKKSNIHEHK